MTTKTEKQRRDEDPKSYLLLRGVKEFEGFRKRIGENGMTWRNSAPDIASKTRCSPISSWRGTWGVEDASFLGDRYDTFQEAVEKIYEDVSRDRTRGNNLVLIGNNPDNHSEDLKRALNPERPYIVVLEERGAVHKYGSGSELQSGAINTESQGGLDVAFLYNGSKEDLKKNVRDVISSIGKDFDYNPKHHRLYTGIELSFDDAVQQHAIKVLDDKVGNVVRYMTGGNE